MRRAESKFVSTPVAALSRELGAAVRAARLARNVTQEHMAERARMSALTWMKVEKGDVSVAMGTWLSALEQTGLLDRLAPLADISGDTHGQALRSAQLRLRARQPAAGAGDHDF